MVYIDFFSNCEDACDSGKNAYLVGHEYQKNIDHPDIHSVQIIILCPSNKIVGQTTKAYNIDTLFFKHAQYR